MTRRDRSAAEAGQPFSELGRLDKLIHEPARLASTTALAACREADFTFLRQLTGLSTGNLGSHLHKLEDAGLVAVTNPSREGIPGRSSG